MKDIKKYNMVWEFNGKSLKVSHYDLYTCSIHGTKVLKVFSVTDDLGVESFVEIRDQKRINAFEQRMLVAVSRPAHRANCRKYASSERVQIQNVMGF